MTVFRSSSLAALLLFTTLAHADLLPPRPASRPAPASASARVVAPTKAAPRVMLLDSVGPWQEVGWGAGETMTFSIKLAGIEGGRGAISVGAPRTRAGRRALKVRGLSESSPFVSTFRRIREDDIVQLDLTGLLPVTWTSDRTLGEKRRELETVYGPPLQQIIQQDGRTFRRDRKIEAPVLEALSGLFLLRSMTLRPGMRFSVRGLGGLTLYQVEMVVHGQDRIVVRERPRETIRLDGVATQIDDAGRPVTGEPPRKFSLWLGSDRARIPYRVQGDTKLGPAEAILTSYKGPQTPLRVRVHRLEQTIGSGGERL